VSFQQINPAFQVVALSGDVLLIHTIDNSDLEARIAEQLGCSFSEAADIPRSMDGVRHRELSIHREGLMSVWQQISQHLDHTERLQDLPYFAEHCLKLRPKTGSVVPFAMNAAQLKLHRIAEDQLRRKGRVRLFILKGRQMGISSYITARFYHRVINNPGTRCLITAHEAQATRNLYAMVKRYHDLMPDDLRPKRRDEQKADVEPDGELVVSCDPAGKGADDTCFAWRRGRVVLKTERRHGLSTMEIAGRLDDVIRKEKPSRVFIDITGMGVGVYDRLREMGHGMVSGVNFAAKPLGLPWMRPAARWPPVRTGGLRCG
jgi:hypothetical protein